MCVIAFPWEIVPPHPTWVEIITWRYAHTYIDVCMCTYIDPNLHLLCVFWIGLLNVMRDGWIDNKLGVKERERERER